MQQRRLRLGDILDDYCPRERRITNHAVVAMIDDQVKQTRCTTCDADHEYKQAKVPASRRKKDALKEAVKEEAVKETVPPAPSDDVFPDEQPPDEASPAVEASLEAAPVVDTPAEQESSDEAEEATEPSLEDDGPVHRRLIRATLPRPEGQIPERKIPEFTIRQPGGRREFDGNRAGGGQGQGRGRRAMRGSHSQSSGQPPRFGNQRPGSPQGQRQNGSRPGGPPGQRGGGRPQGQSRGSGRKRGR